MECETSINVKHTHKKQNQENTLYSKYRSRREYS